MRKIRVLLTMLVIGTAGFFLYEGPWQNFREKTAGNMIRTALREKAEEMTGLSETQIEDILNVIPAEQQEEIIQIAAEHITPVSIVKAVDLVKAGDGDGLVSYAEQELSAPEIEKIEQIAAQNKEAAAQKLSEYGVTEERIASVLAEITGS